LENTEENCEKIWKIWKKGKMIWKISVLVIITPKETSSSSSSFPPTILVLLLLPLYIGFQN
jgi:hypothetical protein